LTQTVSSFYCDDKPFQHISFRQLSIANDAVAMESVDHQLHLQPVGLHASIVNEAHLDSQLGTFPLLAGL
jgi:hypothetical protein